MQEVAKCLCSPILSKSCFLAIIKIYDGCSTNHIITLPRYWDFSQLNLTVMNRSYVVEAGIGCLHLNENHLLSFIGHTYVHKQVWVHTWGLQGIVPTGILLQTPQLSTQGSSLVFSMYEHLFHRRIGSWEKKKFVLAPSIFTYPHSLPPFSFSQLPTYLPYYQLFKTKEH